MMSEEQVICRCAPDDALWSYCSDDHYCPCCGEPVTRLISKNRFPPESPSGDIWVYAQKVREQTVYVFPLAVKYSDASRRVQRRKPEIDFNRSEIEKNNYFESRLTAADTASPESDKLPNRPYRAKLIPTSAQDLPPEGVTLNVPRLAGDFSDKEQLVLRVGNKPSIRVEIVGNGLELSPDSSLIRLTHEGNLSVQVRIHAEQAPVLVSKALTNDTIHCAIETTDVSVITGSVRLALDNSLPVGTEIIPGKPWQTSATLYAEALAVIGQKATISLNFDVLVASIDQNQLAVTIERVEKGGVDFDPPSPFLIDAMYLGEFRSNAHRDKRENPEDPGKPGFTPVIRRLSVRNVGRERIVLTTVGVHSLVPLDWLSASWATDTSEGAVAPHQGHLELEPHDRGEITLKVDLRNITREQLPADGLLAAMVQVKQATTNEVYELRVELPQVRERTACPAPLCIDFGNTSSFASVKWSKDFPAHWPVPAGIADVHELRIPESFHTMLYFRKTALDPFDADCEIGDLAVAAAERAGPAGLECLVSDLKRWVGSPGHFKTVMDSGAQRDPAAQSQRFLVTDLIVLFLMKIVERAEQILRRYRIEQICVSHPSKFDAGRRQAFHGLVDEVCRRITARRPQHPLKRVITDVDEANAVAVGAIFEPAILRDFVQELRRTRTSFVIGCVDFGGGSLDTAVMRFEIINPTAINPRFRSEYLGIGGNSCFGGDNVTRAFMECLLDRIAQSLQARKLPPESYLKCVPPPSQKDACEQQFMRRNYQLLWEISERVKLYQCRHPETAETDSAELEALCSFVQTRLVNDLILMPRVAGRIQVDPAVAEAMKSLVEERRFLIPMDEVYQHKIRDPLILQHGATADRSVTERIEDALGELNQLAARHNSEVDVVVLAGAGCRLPLVEQLVKQTYFPNARIVQDPKRTKFRVAHGLVRFLDAHSGGHRFACSSNYSAFAYEAGRPDGHFIVAAIPNCAPLRTHSWHRLRADSPFQPGTLIDVSIDDIATHDDSPRVYLHQIDENLQRTTYGWFDLSASPADSSPRRTQPLTMDEMLSASQGVDVRVVDSESRMELRLNLGPDAWCIWKLELVTAEAAP